MKPSFTVFPGIVIFLLFWIEPSFSQQSFLLFDSLNKLPYNPKTTESFLSAAHELPIDLRDSLLANRIYLAAQAYDKKDLAKLYNVRGTLLRYKSSYYKSINFHNDALKIALELNDKKLIIECYNNIGVDYRRLDELSLAMENHIKALNEAEEINDLRQIAYSLNSIGNIQVSAKHYDNAISYLKRALDIEIKRKNKLGQAMNLQNIGEAYFLLGLHGVAESYYLKSLNVNKEINQPVGISICYNSLGTLQEKKGNFRMAIEMFNKALSLNKQVGDKVFIGNSYNNLGKVYSRMGNYTEALRNYQQVLEICEPLHLKSNLCDAYLGLSNLYQSMQNYQSALDYFMKYEELNTQILREKNMQYVQEMEVKYATATKEKEIIRLIAERKLNFLIFYIFIGFFILICIISVLYLRYNRQKRHMAEQKVIEIEQQHKINASNAVIQGEIKERSRLSRDLHDGLGSMLSVVKLNLVEMKGKACPGMEAIQSIDKTTLLLDNSIDELRRVAHSLMPESLVKYGLKASLNDFCASIPNVRFYYFGNEQRLEDQLEIIIYRVACELVNNALKYANAKQINVQLAHDSFLISLTVQDDGNGFDTNDIQNQGMGFENIRNRIAAYNGKFNIDSSPGNGTEASVEFLR